MFTRSAIISLAKHVDQANGREMNRFVIVFILSAMLSSLLLSQMQFRASMVKVNEASKVEAVTPYQYGRYEDRKSVMLAIAYSLLLPGLGELYAENFSTGKYYLMSDAGLWLTYAGFRARASWLRQDAKAFASQHAGAAFAGKDDQFDVNIGNFLTTDEYNQQKLRNREFDLVYGNAGYDWVWDADANRNSFKDLRIKSDEVYNNSKFILAGLVINRVISAFNAGRAASIFNRNLRAENDWRIDAIPELGIANAQSWKIRIQHEF